MDEGGFRIADMRGECRCIAFLFGDYSQVKGSDYSSTNLIYIHLADDTSECANFEAVKKAHVLSIGMNFGDVSLGRIGQYTFECRQCALDLLRCDVIVGHCAQALSADRVEQYALFA